MKLYQVCIPALSLAFLLPACSADPDGTSGGASAETVGSQSAAASPEELGRMQEFVRKRLAGAVVAQTLLTASGRNVHCVTIESQPALRGGQLATPPSETDGESADAGTAVADELTDEVGQVAECPAGTVPMPEVTLEDVGRFKTLTAFFSKSHGALRGTNLERNERTQQFLPTLEGGVTAPRAGATDSYQYAHAFRSVKNWGVESVINIWNPTTNTDEHSITQMWVVGGSGNDLQTLEAGINHDKSLYQDENIHFFIYSTRDGYNDKDSAVPSGCYNNSCNDFVQRSTTFFPGATLTASTDGGEQREILVHWAKAGETGHWWLSVAGKWVGYYPKSLFTAVAKHAASIDYGGEITNNEPGGKHTPTDMGSGKFPSAGKTHAAYMRKMRYNDSNPSGSSITWAEATGLTLSVTDAKCYDGKYTESSDATMKTNLYHGGPGYSDPDCK